METPTLPADASLFTRLRTAVHALNVLKDDPTNTFYGPLLNACLDSETYAELARDWRGSDARDLLDERPSLQGRELDLDALARLPAGTLGHEFVGYFRRNGIDPFVSDFPIRSDVDYLSKRYRETHDLFHVITGYGTDELGEMELQAFVFGNLGLRQAAFILLPRCRTRCGRWACARCRSTSAACAPPTAAAAARARCSASATRTCGSSRWRRWPSPCARRWPPSAERRAAARGLASRPRGRPPSPRGVLTNRLSEPPAETRPRRADAGAPREASGGTGLASP